MLEYVFIFLALIIYIIIYYLLLDTIKRIFKKINITVWGSDHEYIFGILLLKSEKKKNLLTSLLFFLMEILVNLIWYSINIIIFLGIFYFLSQIYQILFLK